MAKNCTCGDPRCPNNILDRIEEHLLGARPVAPNAAWPLGPQIPDRSLVPSLIYVSLDGFPIV